MIWIAAPFAAFGVSLCICGLMVRFGPRDAPDGGRKTQVNPVPSSGGVGILAGLVAGLLALAASTGAAGAAHAPPVAGLLVFAAGACLLGWADDMRGLRALLKLVILIMLAIAAAILGPAIGTVWIASRGSGLVLPQAAAILVTAAWMFVMANAVNFMDGSNGLAMGTSALVFAGLGLLAARHMLEPGSEAAAMAGAIAFLSVAAIGGFLVWNLRGRLYAGDAGSLSTGGLIGGLSALLAAEGVPLLIPLALSLPILIDVFLTLAWRAHNRRPLMQAHRDHAYQLLLRAGWGHLRVAALWWGFTAICVVTVILVPLPMTMGLVDLPEWIDAALFGALLLSGSALWLWQRLTLGRRLARQGG